MEVPLCKRSPVKQIDSASSHKWCKSHSCNPANVPHQHPVQAYQGAYSL